MQPWPRQKSRSALLASLAIGVAGGIVAAMATRSAVAAVPAAGITAAVAYLLWMRRYLRRRTLLRQAFPPGWRDILGRRVPFYKALDGEGRRRFEDDVRIFVAEQPVYGPRGAAVADEIKVLIGASAAILSHGMPQWEWPGLRDIVVYSTSFDSEYGVAADNPIAGMVHAQGPIVFSARDLRHGFAKPSDGFNVGLHELAHVMDFASGQADGVPAGVEWVGTAPWIEVIADRLRHVRQRSGKRVLRDYAGEHEAELFAVAVEAFFERPRSLQRRDPELYSLLSRFFGQDPARG